MHVCMCVYVCGCMYVYVCARVCVCVCMYVCVSVCVYVVDIFTFSFDLEDRTLYNSYTAQSISAAETLR